MEKNKGDPSWLNPYYWKKIAIALAINVISVSVIIVSLFLFGIIKEPLSDIVNTFSTEKKILQSDGKVLIQPPHPLTIPVKDLFDSGNLAKSRSIEIFAIRVFAEEFIYRGPIILVAALLLFFKVKGRRWLTLLLWIAGLFLSFHWAREHIGYHTLLWVPVFVAGIPWLWLATETKKLWPSVVCHSMANLSIYFLIKIYQLF